MTEGLDLALSLLEAEQSFAEHLISTGVMPAGNYRPPTTPELQSGVRFAMLAGIEDDAAAKVAKHAADVRAALLDHLAHLSVPDDPYEAVQLLDDLANPATPEATLPGVSQAVDDAAGKISTTLHEAAQQAANEAVAEAKRQGVPKAAIGDANLGPDVTAAIKAHARRAAEAPVTRVLSAAAEAGQRAANQVDATGQSVLTAAQDGAEQASTAAADDVARQAANVAAGKGRAAGQAVLPTPGKVYASELLDGNTCRPCDDVDGRTYDSMESALVDYPGGGGYIGCLGGSRCRGTLVLIHDTEAPPTTNEPGAGPVDAHPVDPTPRGPSGVVRPAHIDADGNTIATHNPPPGAPVPEPAFVDKLVGMLHTGKATPASLAKATEGASELGKANAKAALDRYQAEVAERAAAAPLEFKNVGEARAWANAHWAGPDGYPPEVLKVLRDYTGSGYSSMNGTLRSAKGRRAVSAKVKLMDQAMDIAPRVPNTIRVTRNANLRQLGITTTKGDPRTLVGQEFIDHGFMSTSINRRGSMSGEVRLDIRVPAGSRGVYVSGDGGQTGVISSYGGGESELILDRGSRLVVRTARKVGERWHVEADLVQEPRP